MESKINGWKVGTLVYKTHMTETAVISAYSGLNINNNLFKFISKASKVCWLLVQTFCLKFPS
jgi:hypothetical protein